MSEFTPDWQWINSNPIDAAVIVKDQQTEIKRLRNELAESNNEQKLSESWRTAWQKRVMELEAEQEQMMALLHRCTLHLEQEAEAEFIDDHWQANDAMMLCHEIDELFAASPLPAAMPSDAYKQETER